MRHTENNQQSTTNDQRKNEAISYLMAFVILALLVGFFFHPVVLGYGWIPRGGGDLVSFIYPMYKFAANSLWDGQIPLWNPHQYAGTPLVADNQSGIFYPINLLLFFFNPNFSYQAIEMLVLFHFWLAGAGMFVLLRLEIGAWRLGNSISKLQSPISALFGAIAFMFSDLFIIHAGNLNLIAVAAWLPWVFWAFVKGSRTTEGTEKGEHREHREKLEKDSVSSGPSLRASLWFFLSSSWFKWGLIAGIFLGVATLAGHGQMTFIVATYLGGYAVYQTVVGRKWGALPLLAVVGLVAVGLAGVSLMPAFSLNTFTIRGDFSYEQATNYSLPPRALIGLFNPSYYGRSSADFIGDWQRVEVGYMGILPLIFALYASVKHWNRRTAFYTLSALFFLLLAMGSYTPVHGWIFKIIPVPFQVPARFVLLFNFSVAVLGAMGLKIWLVKTLTPNPSLRRRGEPAPHPDRPLFLGERAGVRGKAYKYAIALLIPALLFTELYLQGRHTEIEWNVPTVGYEHPLATQFLQANTTIERIDEATGLWQPSAAQTFDLYSAGGVFNPLQLANYAVYMGSVGYRGSSLYSLMGIRYIVAGKPEPPGDTNFIPLVYSDDPNVDIYENSNVLPRLQLLYNALILPDQNAVFDAIHAPDFDPSQTIVLIEGEPLSGTGQGDIHLLKYDLNRILIDVETDAPAYLLLSDIYYPGWSVTVNGERGEILLADYAFRAVRVAQGVSRIEMTFSPPGWRLGVAMTLFTFVCVLLVLGYPRFLKTKAVWESV